MTVTISNGIVILLLFLQNTAAQQVVNNAVSQPKATCNTAGLNFNSAQPGQPMNWQQSSNMQPAPISPQPQQSGPCSQIKQQNLNPLADILSALQNIRFTSSKPQTGSPSYAYNSQPVQNQPSAAINTPTSEPKPTFTFQFVPVSQGQETGVPNSIPVQFLANGQMTPQTGPSYYTQNQPTCPPTAQSIQPSSGQSQPIVLTMNPQQSSGQSQPIVYTLQPTQRPGNQQQTIQSSQPSIAPDNSMSLLMSQLQSPSANSDMASLLPMLMGSKQEKSGMKALLPLLLNLLTDKGCGCPHCGCPYNGEPTINGGYSNQVNYSQGLTKVPESSSIEESNKRDRGSKKYKTKIVSDSEETSEEEDDYEYDDD